MSMTNILNTLYLVRKASLKIVGLPFPPILEHYAVWDCKLYPELIVLFFYLGQYLSGTITFAKDDLGKKADIYPLKFVLNEAPKKDKNKNGGNNNNNKKNDSNNGFKESMAEAKCAWVAKMDPNTEEAIALYDSLLEEGAVNQAAVRLARISGEFE